MALLHNVIEGTRKTYNYVQSNFGLEVAEGVQALTKRTIFSTKEVRMKDSLSRIKNQPIEIWMVKIADRITNLQPPPAHWRLKS
jgi:(p)ppGpp synthase/HD superfamily hydrolase